MAKRVIWEQKPVKYGPISRPKANRQVTPKDPKYPKMGGLEPFWRYLEVLQVREKGVIYHLPELCISLLLPLSALYTLKGHIQEGSGQACTVHLYLPGEPY